MSLTSRLIGREDDCARLEKLVSGGGVVTLIGPGGVGKTRLARELVGWREEYGESIPIAHLADVAPGASDVAVAAALGYESVDAAIVGLAEHAGIVVLDNCEHVVGAVRQFVQRLHGEADDVVVVATSRLPLGVDGEHLLPVKPLACRRRAPVTTPIWPRPSSCSSTAPTPQARCSNPARGCSPPSASSAGRLDGLPLAIELAAARTRAIAPTELLDVVDQRLDLLRRTEQLGLSARQLAGARSTSRRHLLAAEERCSSAGSRVFTGPFDLGLAHSVAGRASRRPLARSTCWPRSSTVPS